MPLRGRHGDGQGLHEGQQQHDAPGDAGVHHDLEIQQGLAFHLDGRHDGHQQDDDTRIADGLEEAGQEEVRRQEVGGQEQQHQQEEEKEHGLLHAGQVQTAVGIQLVRFQIEQLAHVGTEDVLAEHDKEQGAQQADEAGDEHVLGIVDAHAGHGLIGTEHGQGHLLEGDHGLADLGGEDDAEDHHGWVAVALLVAADLAHAVQDAPADERRRRGTGQRPQDEDGGQEGEAEQPRPARHEFARDEPEGDEARQTVVVDGGAEDEDEEHHLHDGVAETVVQQGHGLHAAHQHHGQQTGQAGPDDLDEHPAVQHPQEHAYQAHPQRGQGFHRVQQAEAEHDAQTDEAVDIIGKRQGSFLLRGRC